MAKKETSGNEALLLGAVAAKVKFILSNMSRRVLTSDSKFYSSHEHLFCPSINSKMAFEKAVGASLVGDRSLICFEHSYFAGILNSISLVGLASIHGGIVIIIFDDPGAWNSMAEKDARTLGHYLELPLLEPANPQEGYEMIIEAFRFSEEYQIPFLIRVTSSFSQMKSAIQIHETEVRPLSAQERSARQENLFIRTINPVELHERLHLKLRDIRLIFEHSSFNKIIGNGARRIIACGQMFSKLLEIIGDNFEQTYTILKLGTIYPLPLEMIKKFILDGDQILILEENEPVVERAVSEISQKHHLTLSIWGRESEVIPPIGELFKWQIEEILHQLDPEFISAGLFFPYQEKKERIVSEQFCFGCPLHTVFNTLKEIIDQDHSHLPPILIGDPGCATRLSLQLWDHLKIVNTAGTAIAMAAGVAHTENLRRPVAITDDISFYADGFNSLIEVAYTQANIMVIIFDNNSAPFLKFHMNGETDKETLRSNLLIEDFVTRCNVNLMRIISSEDILQIAPVLREGLEYHGLSVVIIKNNCSIIQS